MGEKCVQYPDRDCLGLQKANMLERQMEEYRRQSRETHSQMFERILALEKAESARREQYDNIVEKLDKLIAWQETEQSVPRKRWDAIVDKIIWAVLAAIIAFILGRLGL